MYKLPILLPEKLICGYFDCSVFKNMNTSPQRISKIYEIEYFIEDGKITYLNDKDIRIYSDHILIAKPGDRRYSQLPFKTMFLKFEANGILADVLDRQNHYFEVLHKKQICELWHEIIVMSESNDKDDILFFGKFLTLLSLIIQDSEYKTHVTNYNYTIMRHAKKYIETHYFENISTVDVAKNVNLSESRLRFLFNSTFGVSPHTYLVDTRVSAAKELLWNTDIPMSEIAEKCGFGCQQRLNNIFKKSTGISPGKYRKLFAKKYIE